MSPAKKPRTIFFSYSHDDETHAAWVLGVSQRLRGDGFETLLDQYENGGPAEGWARWMLNQLDIAGQVLVVCTERYYQAFRGHQVPNGGANWEGMLITQQLYDQRSESLKFVPVLREPAAATWIPEPLRGRKHYVLNSERGYKSLLAFLNGTAGVVPSPVVTQPDALPRTAPPINFDDGKWHRPSASEGSSPTTESPVPIQSAPPGREARVPLLPSPPTGTPRPDVDASAKQGSWLEFLRRWGMESTLAVSLVLLGMLVWRLYSKADVTSTHDVLPTAHNSDLTRPSEDRAGDADVSPPVVPVAAKAETRKPASGGPSRSKSLSKACAEHAADGGRPYYYSTQYDGTRDYYGADSPEACEKEREMTAGQLVGGTTAKGCRPCPKRGS